MSEGNEQQNQTQQGPAPETASRPSPEASSASREKFDFNRLLQELWAGEKNLMQTFWLYYFAVVFALGILAQIVTPLATILYLLQLVWAGFMVKPIFLAADKYKGPEYWSLLAKIAAGLIAVAVALRLLALIF